MCGVCDVYTTGFETGAALMMHILYFVSFFTAAVKDRKLVEGMV